MLDVSSSSLVCGRSQVICMFCSIILCAADQESFHKYMYMPRLNALVKFSLTGEPLVLL
jgi:hypothetical protein